MKKSLVLAVALLVTVGAQAAIVTDNLAQELNADDITTVTDGSTWTGTGVSASLNDTGAGLTKAAATVNGGRTSSLFSNTLTAGGYARAGHVGATISYLTGTTLSVELWINTSFTGIPATSHTIFETGGATRGMSITLGDNGSGTNNTLRFAMKDASTSKYVDVTLDAAAMANFTDGHHHQLAVTYDNVNNMSVYIDGALAGSNTTAGVIDWDGTSIAGFWGQDGSGNGAYAIALDDDYGNTTINGKGQGSIAVYRHYSDALTAAEVEQNYLSTIPNYYDGSGDLSSAANWELGLLPSNTYPGLVDTTDGGSQDFGSTFWVYSFQVRQTGGTITDTGDQGIHLRGGASGATTDNCTYEIDDASNTAFGYTNLAVSGQLTLWNQYGTAGNIVSLLNGYATAAILAGTSTADATINILNGKLDVGYFSNAKVTVNMLDGGTGEFILADMYGTAEAKSKLSNMILNFETGSEASFTIVASNVTGNAQGAWETKIAAGQVQIDGAVAGLGAFTIEDVGALGTKISLNPLLATDNIFIAGSGSVLEIAYSNDPNRGVIISGNTDDWSNGLPTNGNPGLIVGGTYDFTNPDNGGMYGISVRQTGGQLTDANLAMRGGAAGTTDGNIITIDDASNDGSTTNLAIAGQLTMWNSNGGDGNELNVLNGYATVGDLNTTLNPAAIARFSILNGRLDIGFLTTASCTVTMQAGGTGEVNLADMTTAALMDKIVLNFESGSEASFTIASSNVTGSAQGTWEAKIAAGTVKLDGVAVTAGHFYIQDVGALGTRISLNDAPVADAKSETVSEDGSVVITLSGSDANGDSLTYAVETSPTNGILSGTAPALTYTPNTNYNGADSFTYTANDGTTNSIAATVSITVTAVNDAPVFGADPINEANATKDVAYDGSVDHATDADGDTLTYSKLTGPAWLSVGTGGSLSGTPDNSDMGLNVFTVEVDDGNGGTDTATLNITVYAQAALVTTTTYIGTGALIDVNYNNTAGTIGSIDSIITDSWDNGLPSDSNPGLFDGTVGDGTAALSSASAWHLWYGVAVRQTGGTLSQANHTMRGGAQDGAGGVSSYHSTLEIDDVSNRDFTSTNLAIAGSLTMWNQNGADGATGNTLSLLNGYADVGILAATSPNDEFVNILNGRLDVGYFSNARVTVNMLAGGTGQFNLADMYGTDPDPDHKSKLKNMILNFESGSEASFTIASSNVTGNAQGAWETKIAASQVKIDGAVAGLGAFTIENAGALGTTITLAPVPPKGTLFKFE